MHVTQGQREHRSGNALITNLHPPGIGPGVSAHDFLLDWNIQLLGFVQHAAGHPPGHIGTYAHGGAAPQVIGPTFGAVRSGAMGDIHRHAEVRVDGTGAYHGTSTPGFFPGAAHDVQIHVQLL